MKRTTRKFALAAACIITLQGIAPTASALGAALVASGFGIHPKVICDRHPPGFYGPAHLMFDYSDKLGMVVDPKYINNIGPFDALSLEFAFGAAEFRGAFTWGHALSYRHFIKCSIEYLAQEPDFSFFSGRDSQWIGQKGFGMEYSFRPRRWCGFIDVHAGFLTNSSECESLSDKFFEMRRNIRRIAGARNYGATLGITIAPWLGSNIRIDVHHDSVKFNTKNNVNRSLVGVGATLIYQQIVSDRFTLEVFGSDRQAYYEYGAWFGSLVHTDPGTHMEIFCRYKTTGGPGVPEDKENRYALGINYSWGGNIYGSRPKYFDPIHPDITTELVNWSNKPAVRPPQVLAKEDELVI